MPEKTKDYKFSKIWTSVKQNAYKEIAEIIMQVAKSTMQKYPAWGQKYLEWLDLHSGPGYHIDAGYGSPIITLELAKFHKIQLGLTLCEINDRDREILQDNIARFDHDRLIRCIPDHNLININNSDAKIFGLIYSDPTDESGHPINLLKEFSAKRPRMDILFSTAANKSGLKMRLTNKKYTKQEQDTWRLSNRIINQIDKKFWWARGLIKGDAHQWTMLLGTNYDNWPKIPGFHKTNSQIGKDLIFVLDHARTESKEIKNEIDRIKAKGAIFQSIQHLADNPKRHKRRHESKRVRPVSTHNNLE
jgi:hypothetical protein